MLSSIVVKIILVLLVFSLYGEEQVFKGNFVYQMQLKAMRDGNGVVVMNPLGKLAKIQLHIRR
jgi:hypothetical protein